MIGDSAEFRCGLVAIVGRPNVGKSTLLNHILGQKLAIISRKPQTTRHRILGIKTTPDYQAVYVDTPGIHLHRRGALNRYMNDTAKSTLEDVEVVVWLIEAQRWTAEDDAVRELVSKLQGPVVVAVNKIDRLAVRHDLLPILAELGNKLTDLELVPISARDGDNVEALQVIVASRLPTSPAVFPEDQLTDRSSRFVAAEFIREQFIHRLGEEVPYRLSVEIEYFEEAQHRMDIGAVIWVERDSQKGIVVGKNGRLMKAVGSSARHELSALFDRPVNLRLWAKVKADWSNDRLALRALGYD